MKLNKAIEIIQTNHTKPVSHTVLDYLEALKLLIEAGKRVIEDRTWGCSCACKRLPGETKE